MCGGRQRQLAPPCGAVAAAQPAASSGAVPARAPPRSCLCQHVQQVACAGQQRGGVVGVRLSHVGGQHEALRRRHHSGSGGSGAPLAWQRSAAAASAAWPSLAWRCSTGRRAGWPLLQQHLTNKNETHLGAAKQLVDLHKISGEFFCGNSNLGYLMCWCSQQAGKDTCPRSAACTPLGSHGASAAVWAPLDVGSTGAQPQTSRAGCAGPQRPSTHLVRAHHRVQCDKQAGHACGEGPAEPAVAGAVMPGGVPNLRERRPPPVRSPPPGLMQADGIARGAARGLQAPACRCNCSPSARPFLITEGLATFCKRFVKQAH